MSTLKNKGLCLIQVPNYNREESYANIDIGNYYEDSLGNLFVVTTTELAKKYHNYIDVPILIRKKK